MKRYAIVICLLLLAASARSLMAANIERSEIIEKVLKFDPGNAEKVVIVDNVFGSIEINGYDGDEVRMTARKTINARTHKHAERAEEEVTLEIFEEGDCIEFYVNGPFREKRGRGVNWRGFEKQGYKVIYDFELQVPKYCSVELQTVNEGDIRVESLEGNFDVSNVNGAIEMRGLHGSGEATTVNGDVSLKFDKNPGGDCSFATINGDVTLYFQSGLSADFYMKTMNGEAFTDFEVTPLPGRTVASSTDGSRKVYKVGHMSGVRAGSGGAEIILKTLNGDMFILSK